MDGYKMNYDSSINTTLTVTGNTNNPAADTNWNFNIPFDGWFRFTFVIIPPYAGGTTYNLNDAVFSGSTVYISLQGSNTGNSVSNPTWWAVVTDPASLALNYNQPNISNNINSTVYDIMVMPNSEYAFASQIAISSLEGGDVNSVQNIQLYELLGVWVDGAYVDSDRTEVSQGERICRRIQTVANENGLL